MTSQHRPHRHRFPLEHLERRIDEILEQRCRFEHMAAPLQTWAEKWSTGTLERWLHLDNLPLEERERALIALALQATEEAGAVIDAYSPGGRGEAHKVLYGVVKLEWEQRHRARGDGHLKRRSRIA
ncbi:MAG: hypothetical protein ACLFVJ_21735 [Persicimonas sp.]